MTLNNQPKDTCNGKQRHRNSSTAAYFRACTLNRWLSGLSLRPCSKVNPIFIKSCLEHAYLQAILIP